MARKSSASTVMSFVLVFFHSISMDRVKFGPIPRIVITWVVLLGGGFWVYLIVNQFLTSPDSNFNWPMFGIAAGIIIVWLCYIGFSSYLTLSYRQTKRRDLYENWRYSYDLKTFSNYEKDSSVFIHITWNVRTPLKIETITTSSKTKVEYVDKIINDLNVVFGKPYGKEWVLDIDALKQGVISVEALPKNNLVTKEFTATRKLMNVIHHELAFEVFPDITFDQLEETPQGFKFEKATVTNLRDNAGSTATKERVEKAVGRAFPAQQYRMKFASNATVEIYRFDPNSMEYKLELLENQVTQLVERACSNANWIISSQEIVDVQSSQGKIPDSFSFRTTKYGYIYEEEHRDKLEEELRRLIANLYQKNSTVVFHPLEETVQVNIEENINSSITQTVELDKTPEPITTKNIVIGKDETNVDGSDIITKPAVTDVPQTGVIPQLKPLPPLPPLPPLNK